MRREFMVVQGEEEYGQVIISLAAMEVSHTLAAIEVVYCYSL